MRFRLAVQTSWLLALFHYAAPANAGLVYELSTVFSGPGVPAGSGPWATAAFTDVLGGVELTLTSGLSGSEFLRVWDFNLDPDFDPDNLAFAYQSGTVASGDIAIDTGVDAFQADGDGLYDIKFEFESSNAGGGIRRFAAGDSVTYLITSTDPISAASFDFLSTPAGGHGPFLTAAHAQGLGDGSESAWITVIPLPSAVLLGLIGMGALAWWNRRVT